MDENIRKVITALCAMAPDFREDLREPWMGNGKCYASDGVMLIRAYDAGYAALRLGARPLTESADKILNTKWSPPVFIVAELKAKADELVSCPACNGRGLVVFTFTYNGGDYETEETCPVCDGDCTSDECCVAVGSAMVKTKYINLMAMLPNCIAVCLGKTDPVKFSFDGGDGVVAPFLKSPTRKDI